MAEQEKSVISSLPQAALQVIADPVKFYRSMARSGGFLAALWFMAVMAVVAIVLQIFLAALGLGGTGGMAGMGMTASIGMTGLAVVLTILLAPIFVAIAGFVLAAIVYVIWILLGSKESYETAFRCIAYSAAILPVTVLISAIPLLGGIAATAWWVFLMIVASIHVHGIDARKAYITFGILGVLLILLGVQREHRMRTPVAGLENMTLAHTGKAIGEMPRDIKLAQQAGG